MSNRNFTEKIAAYMKRHQMVKPGEHVVVGLSGGADSVCLLLALLQLKEAFDINVSAAHLEHGIRGNESIADMGFVIRLCKERGVALDCRQVKAQEEAERLGMSLEEAARELRYRWFGEVCEKRQANVVMTAHHMDDQAETILFRMSRGTGLQGMRGMQPVRELAAEEHSYRLCRPLLCVSKEEIINFLGENSQAYCVDSTNKDEDYARNRLRLQAMPALSAINEKAMEHILRLSEEMGEVYDLLKSQVDAHIAGCCSRDGEHGVRMEEPGWSSVPVLIRRYAILQLMEMVCGCRRDLGATQIEQILALSDAQTGKKVDLPYGMEAVRTYDGILLCVKNAQKADVPDEIHIQLEEQQVYQWGERWGLSFEVRDRLADEKIPEKRYTKWFDYDMINKYLCVRTRKTGDIIQVNAEGGHKKIKDYFIDQKIPAEDRDHIPLLADGNEILWVLGERISEKYKVTDATKRILVVNAVLN